MEGKPASAAKPPENQNLLAVGAKAPSFTLKTPEATSIRLASYRGKAVLLEFYATWCPHCDAEAPHLQDIFASLPRGYAPRSRRLRWGRHSAHQRRSRLLRRRPQRSQTVRRCPVELR